ncbi:MAG: hypothetical protein AAFR27_15505, partial [Pseudomonadota bacterium]
MTHPMMTEETMPGIGHNLAVDSLEIMPYCAKRTGMRPMKFKAAEMCSSMSYVAGTPLWYEINIYQKPDDSFVVETKLFTKDENQRDIFRVQEIGSFEGVFEYLENYDTARDIDAEILNLVDPHMPVARLAMQAAALRLKMEEARRQFDDLVG